MDSGQHGSMAEAGDAIRLNLIGGQYNWAMFAGGLTNSDTTVEVDDCIYGHMTRIMYERITISKS